MANLSNLMFSGEQSVSNGREIIHQLILNLKECQETQTCQNEQLALAIIAINNLKYDCKF